MKIVGSKIFVAIILIALICIGIAISGCTNSQVHSTPKSEVNTIVSQPFGQTSDTLVVFAASSLKGVSTKLNEDFTSKHPGTEIKFNIEGTQVLKQQVENGAQADIFISAGRGYMDALQGEGFTINESIKPLASNNLILILPSSNPGNITSLADLGKPGKKIAMGTAKDPAGNITRLVIDNLANSTYNETWKSNLFNNVKSYETGESGVTTKVSLGEVDAGFVYESSYKAAKNGSLIAIEIPIKDNIIQKYAISTLMGTRNQSLAQDFEVFMLSQEGQQILKDFGFREIQS